MQKTAAFSSEKIFYNNFGLEFIPPERREGLDEVEQAQHAALPNLVSQRDLRRYRPTIFLNLGPQLS